VPLLWIELRGDRGRTDQVAEQNGKVAPVAMDYLLRFDLGWLRRGRVEAGAAVAAEPLPRGIIGAAFWTKIR
jgi:hypothetical protein